MYLRSAGVGYDVFPKVNKDVTARIDIIAFRRKEEAAGATL